MEKKIKLAIVDDQALFREGLISLLNEYNNLDIVIEASNGKELNNLLLQKKPDLVLLDIEMPVMDGFKTTEHLRKQYPEIKILILTMYNEEEIIFEMIKKGAHGFVLKDSCIEQVTQAIYSISDTGYYFNDEVSFQMIKELVLNKNIKPDLKPADLSEREMEIIKLICKEYTNKEIADKLFISSRTVDGHREKILYKTKAKNTAGIVMYAVKNKLL